MTATSIPATPSQLKASPNISQAMTAVVGGVADGVEELVELLVGLEEGLLLAHDHGGSLGRAKHRSGVTDVLPQGSHVDQTLSP